MIVIVDGSARERHPLMRAMHEMRARVFKEKLKWDVEVFNGAEIDPLDSHQPVYMLSTDQEQRELYGSLRLLPTTGPTLLSEVFAEDFPNADIEHPSIWECSRFCVEDSAQERRASAELIAGLGRVALEHSISTILGVFESRMRRIYQRLRCKYEVLGTSKRYGEEIFVGSFPVTQKILDQVEARIARFA